MATDGALRGKEAATLAVARGLTPNQAAAESGASVRSIVRWKADDPDFQARVRDLRGQLLDSVLGRLADAAVKAVTTLEESLTAESEQTRVRAALGILSTLVSVRSAVDIEERVAALEAAAQEGTPQ